MRRIRKVFLSDTVFWVCAMTINCIYMCLKIPSCGNRKALNCLLIIEKNTLFRAIRHGSLHSITSHTFANFYPHHAIAFIVV